MSGDVPAVSYMPPWRLLDFSECPYSQEMAALHGNTTPVQIVTALHFNATDFHKLSACFRNASLPSHWSDKKKVVNF